MDYKYAPVAHETQEHEVQMGFTRGLDPGTWVTLPSLLFSDKYGTKYTYSGASAPPLLLFSENWVYPEPRADSPQLVCSMWLSPSTGTASWNRGHPTSGSQSINRRDGNISFCLRSWNKGLKLLVILC